MLLRFITLSLLLLLAPTNARALDISALQARAAALHLADEPQWRALLHTIPSYLGGQHSTVDAPWFFLAPRGKTDAAAELNATLAAFAEQRTIDKKEEPAACAFIARYRWLRTQLRVDIEANSELAAAFPAEPNCPRFAAWHARLAPDHVTLIFPSAYLNNPSSMFGHTLLRIDSADQDERTRLLAYAVNFGADTGGDGGVLFAVKGLTGIYPGTFSVAPYYELVKKYSALENRDIWEYELSLSKPETEMLVAHLWEMRGVYFDYYFFDENCSYHLLALLDAARPQARLAHDFPLWAIPADTVRAVRERGMIASTVYRPADRTTLQHRLSLLPTNDYAAVHRLAATTKSANPDAVAEIAGALPRDDAALALTAAYEYLHYQLLARKVDRVNAAPRMQSLLAARSAYPAEAHPIKPPAPAVRPDQGHDTARVAVGAGSVADHETLEIRLQPAFHELLDPQDGYVTGAQINFMDWRMRYDAPDDVWRVERLSLLDIASLTPRDDFFSPWSWRVHAGWQRVVMPHDSPATTLDTALPLQLDAGGGITLGLTRTTSLFGFAVANVEASSRYARGYVWGPGAELGLIWTPNQKTTAGVRALHSRFVDTADFDRTILRAEARWHLGQRNSLALDWSNELTTHQHRDGTMLTWTRYF